MPEEEGIQGEKEPEEERPESPEGDETPPETEESLDDGGGDEPEPGGDDPQAVRARKEYRRRKKAEEQARALENQVLTLSGQIQALQEVKDRQPQQQRGMTLESMSSAQIRAWSEQNGHEFDPAVQQVIREKEEQEREDRLLAKWEQRQQQRELTRTAGEQLLEYQASIPALNRPGSEELVQVAKELNGLMNNGLPNNEATQLMAVKMVFGPIGKLKGRQGSDNYSRRNREVSQETNSGGGGGTGQSGNRGGLKNPDGVPVDKETIQHWREMGYGQEEMKERAKFYTAPRRVTMRM